MKVILIAALSVDGKIAEREGQSSLDWTSKEDAKFFSSKTKEAGVLVMGRKTFATIGKPLKDRLTIVMTRAPEKEVSLPGVLEFTADSPAVIFERLKNAGQETLVVAGGASVYGAFLKAGLVNEVFLTLEPVLFGKGLSLFLEALRIDLELLDMSLLGTQAVLLHYKIRR